MEHEPVSHVRSADTRLLYDVRPRAAATCEESHGNQNVAEDSRLFFIFDEMRVENASPPGIEHVLFSAPCVCVSAAYLHTFGMGVVISPWNYCTWCGGNYLFPFASFGCGVFGMFPDSHFSVQFFLFLFLAVTLILVYWMNLLPCLRNLWDRVWNSPTPLRLSRWKIGWTQYDRGLLRSAIAKFLALHKFANISKIASSPISTFSIIISQLPK